MPLIPQAIKDHSSEKLKDREFRKRLLKDSLIKEYINPIEYCIANKNRIQNDIDYKRQRKYNTNFIYPDGKGGFVDKDGGKWINKGDFVFQDGGILADTSLEETIYYNKTIKDIYDLKRLEIMDSFVLNLLEDVLSFLTLIYPAKMPIKDYFPFIDFDYGTKIELPLTEEEKQSCKEVENTKECLESKSNIKITDFHWCYCIIWIDKDRMYMNLDCNSYYFKQIGKNIHFFELTYQCT